MRFDANAAKALRPGEHLTIDSCPGLRLEISQTRRAWTFRYRSPVDDRMRQIRLGLWPAMSYAAAVVEWEKKKAERDAGRDPAVEKRQVRRGEVAAQRAARGIGVYRVKDVCDDFMAGYVRRNRTPKGAAETQRTFDTMLGDTAFKEAATMSRSDAFDLLEQFLDIPVQCARLRGELGAAWDYALDAGRLPDTAPNWWRLIMRGKLKSKGKKIAGKSIGPVKRTLSEKEVGVLVPWLPNVTPLMEDALTMYLWTLCRGSEIMSIHATEVAAEADGWWWTIPVEKTKNRKRKNAIDHRVPLVGRALAIVQRRMKESKGYLFANDTELGHVEQKTIQSSIYYHQPYAKTQAHHVRPRLPVSHWAPHDLRRTSRTLLAAMGCPDPVAEAMLGHMPEGIRGVYNRHTYDKERREWITRLSARLEELASP